jgi:hypothetical protein
MSKTSDDKRSRKVEEAIRSLYDKFKDPSSRGYGCSNIKNKKIVDLRKKIAKRRKELNADKEMTSLEKQLNEEQCRVKKEALNQRRKVDELLRRFNVRGVSDQLCDDIEELAKQEPVLVDECDCLDEDDE